MLAQLAYETNNKGTNIDIYVKKGRVICELLLIFFKSIGKSLSDLKEN